MSFCAASCCTCSLKVSCASATSASWPTASVPPRCRSAFGCWAQHQNRTPNKTPPPPKTPATFGAAQSVADRWRSSKDLRLRKSNFVLHRSPSPHETTINITKGSGALSRSLLLRLLAQIISSSPSSRLSPPSRRASPTVIPLSTPSFLPCRTPSTHLYTGLFHHSIPIGPAPAATTGGFVQTAVSKARKRTALPPSSSLEPRFRYSTSVYRDFDCTVGGRVRNSTSAITDFCLRTCYWTMR